MRSILFLFLILILSSCSNDSENTKITINLRTQSENCVNTTTNEDCSNKPLTNASVFLRELNSTSIFELQANKNGTLYISARPGNYEIALGRRYAFTSFVELFGKTACKFDDSLNNGNGACEEGENSCQATRLSSSTYPNNYSISSDPGSGIFAEMTEAVGSLTIDENSNSVNLEFGLSCS